MHRLPYFALFLLCISLLFQSCATKNSISALIDKKAHDRDGIYYIEFEKPKDATPIQVELAEKGYQVKEGYYFDGLEKKEDRYKFLWFYGKEYESLKGVRAKEKKRDALIAKGDMASFKKLQVDFPEVIEKSPEVEALAYVKSLNDAEEYHKTFPSQKLNVTEEKSQQWVLSAADLLSYRNIYGVSDFTDQKILELIPSTDEINAKILLDHFYDSKHTSEIEINYLSKISEISSLISTEVSKKHFGIPENFQLSNKTDVKKLSEAMEGKISNPQNLNRLQTSLIDQHVLSTLNINPKTISFKDIGRINDYINSDLKWVNQNYKNNKNQRTIKLIHNIKYKEFDFFDSFYEDMESTFSRWNWKFGFTYLNNQCQIHSVRASKRESVDIISTSSSLEQIFFEEVYNKEFKTIPAGASLDNFSYVMLSGEYFLESNELKNLPFHTIFKLDKKNKSFSIDEMILSNLGSNQTYFDGKNKSQVYYYDFQSKKMKRRGK